MCQGVGSGGGAAGVMFVRCQELFPCWTETVPANSKMDPPGAKDKSIRDAGGASVITYLRKSKKCCTAAVRKE